VTKQVKVTGTDIGGITVTGGRCVLQEWSGIHAARIEVALPRLVAATWPDLGSSKVPREFWAGYKLIGTSPNALESLWDAVAAVVQTTGTVTLTRVRTRLAGTETLTAKAVYLGGLDMTYESHSIAKIAPRWQLLAEWA
jgi:hypothetical protein